ncbi:sulfurtransferase [Roseicitreum antarcticum]|uniref:Thiosulfate/3-mercaptopyruvate sulfurtransferase n=1 Tax=Roseicitreum antarcticum TaxID=564137 RepID=A0A1H3D8Z4_9RHOB|nr:rhodanese-like domain-containing protein [Roseicitreum antarcticum]SDX62865.1 thiosulfate/3-mercaptopyruvate sulfurtransferase [Roseicitreum antarcticum]
MLRTTTAALTLAALSLPTLAFAAPEGWKPLLEPAELATILEADDSVRVVHVSGDFAAGHIPGAVHSPYAQWRGGPENPGALRDVSAFADVTSNLGIDADTPVVVVHSGANQSDMGTAARVYWTLKSMGVADLALVNGGFDGWVDAGLPVSTTATEVAASDFQPDWTDTWRVTTTEVAALAEAGDARLVDSRPTGFFEGIEWSIARPGTIKSAENLTYDQFFDGTRMIDPTGARALAQTYGLTDAPLTVSFCNTGHWAAINWFALSEVAGVDNTRLYAESMAEYGTQGHPLQNEPGRVSYMWNSTKKWVAELF